MFQHINWEFLFDSAINVSKHNNSTDRKVESMENIYKFKLQEDIKVKHEVFQNKKKLQLALYLISLLKCLTTFFLKVYNLMFDFWF